MLPLALSVILAGCASPPALPGPPEPREPPRPALAAPPAPRLPAQRPIYIVDPDFGNGAILSRIIAVDPDAGKRTVGGKETRHLPEMALSPDGRRMYVAETYRTRVTRGETRDVLSVYDRATGELLIDDVPVQGRLKYKAYPLGEPFLFLSEDGSRLFVMKYGDPDVRRTRLASFDAETLRLLHEGPYPRCGWRVEVMVDRWVCVNSTGSERTGVSVSLDAVDPRTGVLLEQILSIPEAGTEYTLSFARVGQTLFLVNRDGTVNVVDLGDYESVGRSKLDLPAGRKTSHSSFRVSPDGKRLYLGFDESGPSYNGLADEIWVFDAETGRQMANIDLAHDVTHFTLSAEGDRLYAVSPSARSLMVYDARTYEELAVLSDLGGSPARVVVPTAP